MTTNGDRPTPLYNRPGLAQLAYRIGDYRRFRQRLLAALPTALSPPSGVQGQAPLASLTTRDDADPAIALLDAWAVVADVLTFYQERIANEGFLRTAVERRSILELARAIGYELDPGVAASAYLSFLVEDAPGSPTAVTIPERTQIMSVPVKDELPQTFETTDPFTAYLEWNGLRPRPHRPQSIGPQTRQLYVQSTNTQLQPGDRLLLVDAGPDRQHYLLPLQTVETDTDAGHTLVSWPRSLPAIADTLRHPRLFAFRQQAHLFGHNAPNWETMPAEVKLAAIAKGNGAIQGGVFRSDSDGLLWTSTSQGLPNQDITCLVTKPGPDGQPILFAGTPEKGIFRSTNQGLSWQAANSGLTNLKIQTLHVDSDGDPIYAGTPNGGVFRSKDNGDTWVAINTGTVRVEGASETDWQSVNTSIPDTIVRSLLTYTHSTHQGCGTLTSHETTVTGKGTEFKREVASGDYLATNPEGSGKVKVVSLPPDQPDKLVLERAFGSLSPGTPYEATSTIRSKLTLQDIANAVTALLQEFRDALRAAIAPIETAARDFLTDQLAAALGVDASDVNLSNQVLFIDTVAQALGIAPGEVNVSGYTTMTSLLSGLTAAANLITTTFKLDEFNQQWQLAEHITDISLGTNHPGQVEIRDAFLASLTSILSFGVDVPVLVPLLPTIAISGTTVHIAGFGLIKDLLDDTYIGDTVATLGGVVQRVTYLGIDTDTGSEEREIIAKTDSSLTIAAPFSFQIETFPMVNILGIPVFTVKIRHETRSEFQVGRLVVVFQEDTMITQEFMRPSLPGLIDSPNFAMASLAPSTKISRDLGVVDISIQSPLALPVGSTIATSQNNELNVSGTGTQFTWLDNTPNDYTLPGIVETTWEAAIRSLEEGGEQAIVNVHNDQSLTVAAPFAINLTDDTDYFIFTDDQGTPKTFQRKHLFAGTDDGLYHSKDFGRNWYLLGSDEDIKNRAIYSLAYTKKVTDTVVNLYLFAGTDSGLYRAVNHETIWSQFPEDNHSLTSKTVLSLLTNSPRRETSPMVFVGTNAGLYLIANYGDPLPDGTAAEVTVTDRPGDVVYALTASERDSVAYALAATQSGLFKTSAPRSEASPPAWSNTPADWEQIEHPAIAPLTQIAVTAGEDGVMYTGSRFAGFLAAATDPPGAAAPVAKQGTPSEWPDFAISHPGQLDLETLYPQLLPESWVVLVDDRAPQNPEQQTDPRYAVRQIAAIATIDRQDFGLSGKLTRLELDQIIDPNQFGLRSALVLGRSTELPLAPEPLTVGDRQRAIFADPLAGDTIYLQDFIHNLQPDQTLIATGQHLQMQLSDVGGVVRSRYGWTPLNTGLRSLTLNALAMWPRNGASTAYVLAATQDGLYWSSDGGADWRPVPALQFIPTHTLSSLETRVLIGAGQGVYQVTLDETEPDPATPPSVTPLPLPMESTVLSILAYTVPEIPEAVYTIVALSGITLTMDPGISLSDIPVGTMLTVGNDAQVPRQTRVVTQTREPNQVVIDRGFESALAVTSAPQTRIRVGGTAWFLGTNQGLFRSTDQGQRWEHLPALRDQSVNALLHRHNQGSVEVFAGTEQGLYVSRDTGLSWLAAPGFPHPQSQMVYALVIWQDRLVVGTGKGLYSLPLDRLIPALPEASDAWLPARGLGDRAILSLRQDSGSLYVGTDQGVYRSVPGAVLESRGDRWEALDAGLTATAGRTLLITNNQLLVGTEQGLFATAATGPRLEPVSWSRSNPGLLNTQITALASSQDGTTILAGTTAGGYRSTSGGRTWEPWDEGLMQQDGPDKLPIPVALAISDSSQIDWWVVGTPEGVFIRPLTLATPNSWQPLGRETLPYPDIQTLESHGTWLLAGTINGGLLKVDLRQLGSALAQGTLNQLQWQPTGLNNTDVQAIAVTDHTFYAGTRREGVFRSDDGGDTWQQITAIRAGIGTFSSEGNQVTWRGAPSDVASPTASSLVQVGDVINVAGQSRSVTSLEDQQSPITLTVDVPFRPNLPAGTGFTINTGLTNQEITALVATATVLYAGTAGSGVFRSEDGGDRWQQVIANLEDLDIRCLHMDGATLWAGTATGGVFRSDNQGDLWVAANVHLTNTDIQAILCPQRSTLLVGGIGFLRAADALTVKPVQRHDRVQVVKPARDVPFPALPLAPQTTYQTWFLRDREGFEGTLQTTHEQAFPLLPAATDAPWVSEVVTLRRPPTDQQRPVLLLQAPLTYSYDPRTVTIAANVVPATHGETAEEVLGSGDGNAANQHVGLTKPPLTYVSAPTARGTDSTLEVRVDGVLWQQQETLYSLEPQQQAYIIRIEDDGTTTVTFGDGRRGARLPSGQENVTARYRSGIGTDGNVPANQLSILKTRPQGIDEVTNPLAATGGTNRESLTAARTNAPPTARTLGRIVSLRDFQDFAQGFAGVGKAQARSLWDGSGQVVHITIAGAEGAAIPETSSVYQSLITAIDQSRDPLQQVQVDTYEALLFNVEARVLQDARYLAATVKQEIVAVLSQMFAFDQRQFGQSVTTAAVIAAIQQVPGVIAVDLDALYLVGRSKALNDALVALTARYDTQSQQIRPAQLILLNRLGIQLTFVSVL